LTSDAGTIALSPNGSFSITVPASTLSTLPNTSVKLTLMKDETPTDDNGLAITGQKETNKLVHETFVGPFIIAPQITLAASNISVTCQHSHTFTVTGNSSPFSSVIPILCATANPHDIFINVTPASGLSVSNTIAPIRSDAMGTSSRNIVITDNAGNSVTYGIDLTPAAGNANVLTGLSVRQGNAASTAYSNVITNTLSGNSTQTLTITSAYGSQTSGNIHWTLAEGAILVSAKWSGVGNSITNGSAFTLPTGTSKSTLVLVIKASNNTQYTVNVDINRAGNNNVLTGLSVRQGNASSTAFSNIISSTLSGSSTQTLTITTAYSNQTSGYIHWTLATGATVTSAKWGNAGNSISNGALFTLPTGTNKSTLVMVIKAANGIEYTVNVDVVRAAGSTVNLIDNVYFRTGSTLSSSGSSTASHTSAITTANLSTTRDITIPDSYSSYNTIYAHVALPSNASLPSATFGGSNASVLSNNIVTITNITTTYKELILKVTAGGATYDVKFNVRRAEGITTSTTLSNLRISNTTNTNSSNLFSTQPSSFSSSTRSYTVYVESDTEYIYIYPTTNNNNDNITLSGGRTVTTSNWNSNNNSGYFTVRLNLNSNNTVYVDVNSSSNRYTLYIERGSSQVNRDVSLDSLIVSKSSHSTSSSNSYNLYPNFSHSRLNYEVDIPRNVSEVFIHATPYRSNATLSTSSNASEVSKGVYRVSISSGQTKTVTVTVKRNNESANYTIVFNSDNSSNQGARLSNLRVAERESTNSNYQYTLLPAFSADTTEYMVLVPYDGDNKRDVYIQGLLNNSNDRLAIDNRTVSDGEWRSYTLNAGDTRRVRVEVEGSNNRTTTYNLNIVAAPRNPSTDANLRSLSLRSGTSGNDTIGISPSFSANTTSYTANNVADSVDTLRVYTEVNRASAVLVDGVPVTSGYATIALPKDKNSIRVLVYAEDCKTTKTYTITINRGNNNNNNNNNNLSADSTLSGLEVRTAATNSRTMNLIPGFDKSIQNYRVNVGGEITHVNFKPTTSVSGATIRLLGANLSNGQWSNNLALNTGTNYFAFVITAPNGRNTTSYLVEVVRGLSVNVSDQSLRINGRDVVCAAYNINGNNYFKLRDVAFYVRGTPKRFNVTYNEITRVVNMISNQDYVPIGQEALVPGVVTYFMLSDQPMMLDSRSINLTAYNINGNNYFMLRELAALFDFGVTYNNTTRTVEINTNNRYVPDTR